MDWSPCVSEELGLAFLRPPLWDELPGGPDGSLIVMAPPAPDAFRSNFSVVVRSVDEMPTSGEFTEVQLTNLQRVLTEFQLLDLEDCTVAGAEAKRMLCTHRQGVYSLTLEQWWVLGEGGYLVLSGTAESLQYPDVAESFSRIVASFGSVPDD